MVPLPIYVLTGCTAVGKTELALRWAEANNAEIVSCDSLLFYRGMDIGTAKPSKAELARVPHHLIDNRDVSEAMDITDYVDAARKAVSDITRRNRNVLVTGGSGFYLKAFFRPVADGVAVPESLRDELRQRLETAGLANLLEELRQLNPQGLDGLDVQNPRRVSRALERCLASGRMLVDLKAEFAAQPSPFAEYEIKLGQLVREKSALEARIGQRVAAMMRAGLVEEVKNLLANGLTQNPSATKAIGYRETIEFLAGRLPADQLPGMIAQNTRALVKKQRTWFKTQLPAHRLIDAADVQIDQLFS